MSNVISNTSPLIAFSGIRRLDLLYGLFTAVRIPPKVRREIVSDGIPWSEATDIREAIARKETWIQVVPAPQSSILADLAEHLGVGEAEAIALACERNLPVLLDDLAARKAARRLGLSLIGTLGILARSKRKGLIPLVKPLLQDMRGAGIYYSKSLENEFLRQMGET
jgi:predicted nucleic acid-binding protein